MADALPIRDDGAAGHLLPGTPLPDLALPSTTGGVRSLAQLPGRAIIYCYTWTGRPGLSDPPHWDDIAGAHGSTPQSEGFRDLYGDFAALGAGVFGLSVQTNEFQQEMAARLRLPFEVLSDAELLLTTALRLPTFTTGGSIYLKRLSMVIEDGVIAKLVYPVPYPKDNARDMLALLMQ